MNKEDIFDILNINCEAIYGIMILLMFLYAFLIHVNCETKQKSKESIHYFRQQVEETEDSNFVKPTEVDDQHLRLVSLLVTNMNEVFDDITKTPKLRSTKEHSTSSHADISLIESLLFRPTVSKPSLINSPRSFRPTVPSLYPKTFISFIPAISPTPNILNRCNKSDDLNTVCKAEEKERLVDVAEVKSSFLNIAANSSYQENTSYMNVENDPRRSCIMCNNVATEDCNDPKHKLIQSVMCERSEDECYSMHTPFGIVDRGCFSANHNLTTYVCSCNLCNDIPLSKMPYMFTSQRDWVDNVIELSRTRHFRKSIYKEMACLRCEVNVTKEKGNEFDSNHCLDGHTGNLPIEDCRENEVCAVKALKAEGYIWRGCVRAPLYNYWISLCKYDLCNYDSIRSVYDYI